MISSNFYKVFEYCILQFIKKYCRISPLQFGYRENTNTLMPVAILKECISKFYNDGNTVYACFLDLSKAFERISHEQLLSKLACTDLPEFVINFLSYILLIVLYPSILMDFFSDSWRIKRSVRQGGILSAHLFAFYLDEVLKTTHSTPAGCRLGLNTKNIMAYADDVVLLSPTSGGLRQLIYKIGIMLKAG